MKVLILAPLVRIAMRHYLQSIVNEARASNVDLTILAPKHVDVQTDYPIVKFGGGSGFGVVAAQFNPMTYLKIAWTMLRFRPDLVHVINGENRPIAIWALALARLLGAPSVTSLHDPVPHPCARLEVATVPLGNISKRLATSHNLHDRFYETQVFETFGKPIHVFPFPDIANLFPKNANLTKERMVLFFGRVEPYKGIDNFVEVGLRLNGAARFILAGSGAIPDNLSATMQSRRDIFEVHNRFVSDEEMIALMDRASVVLLPYHSATQSAVPAAAASRGAVPVGFAVGGLSNQLPDVGGVAAPAGDLDALTAAVAQALAWSPGERAKLVGREDPFVSGLRHMYSLGQPA